MQEYRKIAESLIMAHEGLELKPYRCTAGKLTIGYGRNLDDKGITTHEALFLLKNDIAECEGDLSRFDFWCGLSDNRKAALLDMRLNLGAAGFRGFRKTIAFLSVGSFDYAADEMLDSKAARQTGNRYKVLAELIRNG